MTTSPVAAALQAAIDTACARIAPAWPLDRLIAVNPYWGFVDKPIHVAAAALGALSGTTLLMPRPYYSEQHQRGRFTAAHVQQALTLSGTPVPLSDVLTALASPAPPPVRRPLATDGADRGRDLTHAMPWAEFVTWHISQAAAAYFDDGQASWGANRAAGLYGLWRRLAIRDHSPRMLMGFNGFRRAVAALPEDPLALIAEATEDLAVLPASLADYFTALLMSVNGWASHCAFRRWDARLGARDDGQIVDLLAVRLAWELLLSRQSARPDGGPVVDALQTWQAGLPAPDQAHDVDWVMQRALELAYQEALAAKLAHPAKPGPAGRPDVQAVFCIDVRSEVLRRSLEAVAPTVQTLGFAGFFGLPIAYEPLHGPARPQLPGLLPPGLLVREQGEAEDRAATTQRRALDLKAALKDLQTTALSSLSYVEIAGLASLPGLLREGLAFAKPAGDVLRPAPVPGLRPKVAAQADGSPLDLQARTRLAAGILKAMSLTDGFARLVALIGHGAGTVNNPQAAGLHCGACGGQTGEINALALADLLNDPAVRAGLAGEGIFLGPQTHCLAGLHNTTTDDIELFDLDQVPASHQNDVEAFRRQLADGASRARAERAPALGISVLSAAARDQAVRARARDWSEVRPEWGLAGNAAFIVAPRARTYGLDLAGRTFLHDYRWEQDENFAVLETIITAPMLVTHWINMQYLASTVDNQRYGSGNKVLHNVVGGHLGVFEGAGGDLRIGLAKQSLHNGQDWLHPPLRLSVFIEAPTAAIDGVLARHPLVRDLVAHEWLHLFHLAPVGGGLLHRQREGWEPVGEAVPARPTASASHPPAP
jgi:uncharacterized protein YbcC (UPF0753/DUF2309 family)